MKTLKIRFLSEGEAGYWTSAESRFSINPQGFRHNITADYYELRDAITKQTTRHDNVTEAKNAALEIAIKDAKFNGII